MNNGKTRRKVVSLIYPALKRISDVLFAIIGTALFLPFGLIIAALIRAESKGPVFFRQRRAGKYGRIFRIFKFRTMRIETEKDGKPLSDMQRMTKIGNVLRKTSIDEVPQFLNIIKGEMSFIGPRPLPVEYIPRYTAFQMRRHEVKPGISGWAQVNGRNAIGWDRKFELDVWYVEHLSFLPDIKIVFLTIRKIFAHRDVNSSAALTMEEFTGDGRDG